MVSVVKDMVTDNPEDQPEITELFVLQRALALTE
jgi:hypothetical protein